MNITTNHTDTHRLREHTEDTEAPSTVTTPRPTDNSRYIFQKSWT